MPEVTGLELCRTIRTFDQNTPIFFCSGAVTEADKSAAFSAGAQGYVGKPFDPDDLIRSLRDALRTMAALAIETLFSTGPVFGRINISSPFMTVHLSQLPEASIPKDRKRLFDLSF